MTSFYDDSDLNLGSLTLISGSTHPELRLIRDPAVLAQGIRQSPPVS